MASGEGSPNHNVPSPFLVYVITWNTAGAIPLEPPPAFFGEAAEHDLVCVSLQECSIAGISAESALEVWSQAMSSALERGQGRFRLVASKAVAGLSVMLFSRSNLPCRLLGADSCRCSGMGIGGKLNANKGAAGILVEVAGRRLGFIGAHFTAGSWCASSADARCQDFNRVLLELSTERAPDHTDLLRWALGTGAAREVGQGEFLQADMLVFMGDLNARLCLEAHSEVLQWASEALSAGGMELLKFDELASWRRRGAAFSRNEGWHEGSIRFTPTYKLEAGYSGSCLPAWCDRVLWRSPGLATKLRAYESTPGASQSSDHAPVWASFEVASRAPESPERLPALTHEVRGSDGTWLLGHVEPDFQRAGAGGTVEFLVRCPLPGGSTRTWLNVADRDKAWRLLESPIDLEVFSISANAWCKGLRLQDGVRLEQGQLLARYKLPCGRWSDKVLEKRDEGRVWRRLAFRSQAVRDRSCATSLPSES